MTITAAQLQRIGVSAANAQAFAAPLSDACSRFSINTPQRVAAFLSQCAHESAMLSVLTENLNYTTPARIRAMWPTRVRSDAEASKLCRNPEGLANVVYANRLGNGNLASGDGWRYRGRGLFQLTGRGNYTDAAQALGRPYVGSPDLVALPADAALTAAWFWHTNKLNLLADAGNVRGITWAINGPGLVGLDHRQALYTAAVGALA
jgi:putative chitinase